MNHSIQSLPSDYLTSLGEELARIADALAKVSSKLQTISSVKTVNISKKTDPEMFTKEFIQTIRKSRQEFEKGEYSDYKSIRPSLDL